MSLWPLNKCSQLSRILHVYLLGRHRFDEILAMQQHLVEAVEGDPSLSFLILCEHSPFISIGREGSAGHILLDTTHPHNRDLRVKWVNRGGGCLLHAPGQIAVYPIFSLDTVQINLQQYVERLHHVLTETLVKVGLPRDAHSRFPDVRVGDRRIGHVGVAVRDSITSFGCTLNVNPELGLFRYVMCEGDSRPMTSIEREMRVRVRPATVRQLLLDQFAAHFAFERVSLFHQHSVLSRRVSSHAVVTRPG